MTGTTLAPESPPRPQPPRQAPARRAPLVAALGFAAAAAVVCAVFVWTRGGQALDSALLPAAEHRGYALRTSLSRPAAVVLELLRDKATLVTLASLFAVVLMAGVVTGRAAAGVAGLLVAGCSAVLTSGLKEVVLRPDFDGAGSTSHNSFPSGHTGAAAGLLFGLLIAVPPRARWWIAAPGAAGVSVVAAATMAAGWHRLSDVLAAVLLACALCCVAVALLPGTGRSHVDTGGMPWPGAGLVPPLALLPVFYSATTTPGPPPLLAVLTVTGVVVAGSVLAVTALLRGVDLRRSAPLAA
ncbi:phosphatase PAP2 family protein [Amycolatopsis minnesotensis]|uniref:Phosphatase PAP2 family protein n=1 Tax=Amycolatopsis minnesotensis TaxID=337894 RepID=A0ABN2Q5C2_9PSEU